MLLFLSALLVSELIFWGTSMCAKWETTVPVGAWA